MLPSQLLSLMPAIANLMGQTTLGSSFQIRAEKAAAFTIAAGGSGTPDAMLAVAFVWQAMESGFSSRPAGSNDQGTACGAMQVHNPESWLPGSTCDKLREDYKLSVVAGLTVIKYLTKKCGTLGAAMTAYSTGQCPSRGWILPLVSKRCKAAGLSSSCEVR